MEVYRIKGRFRMGGRTEDWQDFSKEVISGSDSDAIEKVYSLLGSKHRVKRMNIEVDDTEKISKDEVEERVIKDRLSMQMEE